MVISKINEIGLNRMFQTPLISYQFKGKLKILKNVELVPKLRLALKNKEKIRNSATVRPNEKKKYHRLGGRYATK